MSQNPQVRNHKRSVVVTANDQVRAATVINPGFNPEQRERALEEERGASARAADGAAALLELDEAFSDVPVEYEKPWDSRLLPASMREEQSEAEVSAQGNKDNKDNRWDRRLMPERLRNLLSEEGSSGDMPESVPAEEFKIFTREDVERARNGGAVSVEEPTLVDFEPAFPGGTPPPPPDDNSGGGDGSGGDENDLSHLPPPPASFVPHEDRLNRALLTASYSFMGAASAFIALNVGTTAMGGESSSSTAAAALAAGLAIPHAARVIKSVSAGIGMKPEWRQFQAETGWKSGQCRRWAKSGFSPQEAQSWEAEFRARPGLNLDTYPPGGDAATVKIAKEFRDIGGPGSEQYGPEDVSDFIQAYITPKNIIEWQRKFLPADPSVAQKEALDDFMFKAHTYMSDPKPDGLGLPHGYKSVDSSMMSLCRGLGIPDLRRYDKNDDSVAERYSKSMGSSSAALADSIYR